MNVFGVRMYEWSFATGMWIAVGDPVAYDLSATDAFWCTHNLNRQRAWEDSKGQTWGMYYDTFRQPSMDVASVWQIALAA